jgi:hypothetical protein
VDRKIVNLIIGCFVMLMFLISPVTAIIDFENVSEEQDTLVDLGDGIYELTAMRTSTTKYFYNTDGSTTAEIGIKPVHYQDEDGLWQDIDTTIVPYTDQKDGYEFAAEENDLKTYFTNDYSNPVRAVKTVKDDYYLTWEPVDMAIRNSMDADLYSKYVDVGSVETEDNRIIYRDAFPFTDDEYIVAPYQLKHNIILSGSPSELLGNYVDGLTLDYSGYLEYPTTLSVFVNNNEFKSSKSTTSNAVEFRDLNDNVVFTLPAPYAYEKGNSFNSVGCEYQLIIQNSVYSNVNRLFFSIKTPYDWLVAPDRAYPVIIDPTIGTIQPGALDGKDTFMLTGVNTGGVDQREFNIGADPDFWMSLDTSTAYIQCRILIQFGFSSIPVDADITSADVEIYFYSDINGNQAAFTIEAYRMTTDWVEGNGLTSAATSDGASWNRSDGTNRWNTAGGGGDFEVSSIGSGIIQSYGWYSGDITQQVKDWHSLTDNNYGMVLIGTAGGDSVKNLRTSDHTTAGERPKLVVQYVSNYKPEVKSSAVDTLYFKEDDPSIYIEMDDVFSDQDVGDTLTFSVWTGSVWSEVVPYDSLWITAELLLNDSVEITPKPNKFGADTLKLNATDTSLEFAHHTITIVISSINDAPVINNTVDWKVGFSIPPPDITTGKIKLQEDVFYNITVSAWDQVETTDVLTFSDNTTLFEIDSSTGKISFRPRNEHVGMHYVKITVNDGKASNNIDTINVIFEITNTNDKPQITMLKHGSDEVPIIAGATTADLDGARQGLYFNFTITAKDDDMATPGGDSLSFEVTPEEIFTVKKDMITPTIANVSFKPTNDEVGKFVVEIMVTDGINSFDELEVTIDVDNMNDAPEIIKVIKGVYEEDIDDEMTEIDLENENQATEHKEYTFTVVAREIDATDTIEFTTENSKIFKLSENEDETDAEARIWAQDVTFTPTIEHGRLGYAAINITVKDMLKARDYLIVNISVKNENDPPSVDETNLDSWTQDADPSTRKTKENMTWTFTAQNIEDPDGDLLTYYWDFDANDGSTDDEDDEGEEVVWTFDEAGEYTITLTAVDSKGALNSTSETITVIPPKTTKTESGDEDAEFPFEWIVMAIVIVLVIILVLTFLFVKKKREREEAEEEEEMAQMQNQMQQQQTAMYGMAAAPEAAGQPQDQYGGLTADQYAMYQQYLQVYPTLTVAQFGQYIQMYSQMTPEQQAQYQQQMMAQQTPDYYQQQYMQQSQVQEQPAMTGAGAGGEQELSLPPAAVSSDNELQAKLPPAEVEEDDTEAAVTEPPKPKVKQPKVKSKKADEGEDGQADACPNCGTPIKPGWFICPECKSPVG